MTPPCMMMAGALAAALAGSAPAPVQAQSLDTLLRLVEEVARGYRAPHRVYRNDDDDDGWRGRDDDDDDRGYRRVYRSEPTVKRRRWHDDDD